MSVDKTLTDNQLTTVGKYYMEVGKLLQQQPRTTRLAHWLGHQLSKLLFESKVDFHLWHACSWGISKPDEAQNLII